MPEQTTDTNRLEFLLRFIRIDDIGDDTYVPGAVVSHENLEDALTWQELPGEKYRLNRCYNCGGIRELIDRALHHSKFIKEAQQSPRGDEMRRQPAPEGWCFEKVNPQWIKTQQDDIAMGRKIDLILSYKPALQWLVIELSRRGISYALYKLGAGVTRITTNTDICPCCKRSLHN